MDFEFHSAMFLAFINEIKSTCALSSSRRTSNSVAVNVQKFPLSVKAPEYIQNCDGKWGFYVVYRML